MFGLYRTVLAIFVVLGHLGSAPYIGAYSVFGFYILSGYLMTRIMKKSYGYHITGVTKYFTNRFLRIFPLYWFSIALSFVLILFLSEKTSLIISEAIFLPQSINDVLRNLFIVFSIDSEPRLTPPSWALTVELFYYIIIAFGFSKNKNITLIWFFFSALYTIYLLLGQASFSYRYFTIPAASLPFSLGSLIFFITEKKRTRNIYLNSKLIFIPLLLISNYLFTNISSSFGFYINLFLFAYLVYHLSLLSIKPLLKYDIFIGNLSYPLYLLHYQCGIIISVIFSVSGINLYKGDFVFFATSLILCLVISYITASSIENKIELLRNKIRPQQPN